MEVLICPECGGRVDQPSAGSEFAKCAYCATTFRIGGTVLPVIDRSSFGPTNTGSTRSGRGGAIFIAVIVLGIVMFAVFKFMSVQRTTSQTVNDARDAANDAKVTANAIREAANAAARTTREAANAVQRQMANVSTPSPASPLGKK